MSYTEEILDIVNEFDEVIGQIPRAQVVYWQAEGPFTRVINAFVVHEKTKKLWIPRRTAHKEIFPLCLDVGVGGHVAAGEDYFTAFARELKEELNLDLKDVSYKKIGYFRPVKDRLSAFMEVYEITLADVPPFNRDDFETYYWLTPEEVLAMIEKGSGAKTDLAPLIRACYLQNK